MKYKQKEKYQLINGAGPRECSHRWELIKDYFIENVNSISVDIGSAEGFFTKKISEKTKGTVISIEGSDYVYNIQKDYCKNEIKSGQVLLKNVPLTHNNINLIIPTDVDYCILLSVLHWFDEPDIVLKKLANISNYMFIELPDLTDVNCYNQEYLKYIKETYKTIDNYIQTITNKKIIGKLDTPAHTSKYRVIYILSNMEIIKSDNLYHMIHGNSETLDECYAHHNYKIIPISVSPVVKYLQGDIDDYISQSKIFNVRENSIKYHLELYNQNKSDFTILVIKRNDIYIVCDGMHRSSVLFFKGHQFIKVKVVSSKTEPSARFENYIRDENIYKLN